jgi:hypothetical protein
MNDEKERGVRKEGAEGTRRGSQYYPTLANLLSPLKNKEEPCEQKPIWGPSNFLLPATRWGERGRGGPPFRGSSAEINPIGGTAPAISAQECGEVTLSRYYETTPPILRTRQEPKPTGRRRTDSGALVSVRAVRGSERARVGWSVCGSCGRG